MILHGSGVEVCSVIAFPHGNSTTAIKVLEAESAVLDGATEIDMVVNLGKVLGGDWSYVSQDIKAVNDVVVSNGALLKVIFENDYLEDAADHQALRNLCLPCRCVREDVERLRVCEATQWDVLLPRRNGSPASVDAPTLALQRSIEGRRRCAEFGRPAESP